MAQDVATYISEIRILMEKQLRVKGRDLQQQTRRAGRRLPRKVRRDLAFLIKSEKIGQNPKLSRMLDNEKLRKAHANIVQHLEKLDPREALFNMILGIVASIALMLIVVFVVLLYVLVKRGYV